MPLVRISLREGKSPEYRRALGDGIYAALRETFDVPDEDRFILVGQHDAAGFQYSPSYLGINRSDDLVIVEITVSNTRGVDKKKALYAAIARSLAGSPGVEPSNVMIILTEVLRENWSFGDGLATYVT